MKKKDSFRGLRIKVEMVETGWEKLQVLGTKLDEILTKCPKKNRLKTYVSTKITCRTCPQKEECLPVKTKFNKLYSKLKKREFFTPLDKKELGLPRKFRF